MSGLLPCAVCINRFVFIHQDGHTGVVGDGGSSAWVISDDESDTKNADVIVVGDNCLKLENSKNFDYIEVDGKLQSCK